MKPATMKGPAIFLAQFAGNDAPFNSLPAIAEWAASLGYKGIQIPSWDARLFDLEARGGEPRTTARRCRASAAMHGVAITELSTHLQGQLVAVHPAYDSAFDGFAAPEVRGNPKARTEWAVDQLMLAAQGVAQSRARRPRDVLRRAGLALRLSVAAAARRPDRDGLRRAGAALAADPRRLRRGRRGRLLRDPSGRGHVRRRDLRDVPRAGQQSRALLHQLRSLALRAAASRLSRVHRHLPRAHQGVSRQGRRVQPDRAAGRLFGLSAVGEPGRALPLARRRAGRFRRRVLQARAVRLCLAGRCSNGSAA